MVNRLKSFKRYLNRVELELDRYIPSWIQNITFSQDLFMALRTIAFGKTGNLCSFKQDMIYTFPKGK